MPGCFFYQYAGTNTDLGGGSMHDHTHIAGVALSYLATPRISLGSTVKYFHFDSDLMSMPKASGFNQDIGATIRLTDMVNELGDRFAEDVNDLVDLVAVEFQLGIAVGHGVDRFVLFEAFALEAKALGQLLDLGDEDEVEVLLAEVALALRAVDGAVVGILDELENKLPLALRTLENFG